MGIDADMFNSPEWMSEALRIGNTGLWAIEVDEENGKHRMTANETMLLLLGLETHPSPEDCFRHWYGRVDEAYRAAVDECVGKMLSTGQRYEVQYPWLHPVCGRIFVRCGGKLLPGRSKNGLLRLKGYHQDVSELESMRERLRENLSRFETACRIGRIGVFECTRGSRILFSANEGIIPHTGHISSFIPYNLRVGFQLPTPEHQDALFAYYFYRVLQRARQIKILYNSVTQGLSGGEKSRFLLQMKYESGLPITEHNFQNHISVEEARKIEIVYNKEILDTLYAYTQSPEISLSPSALNIYIDCPLRFYFKYIAGIKEKEEMAEELDQRLLGNIFHECSQSLYATVAEQEITADVINRILHNREQLDKHIRKSYLNFYDSQVIRLIDSGSNELILEVIKKYLRQMFQYDKTICPFRIISMEKRYTVPIPINTPNGLKSVYIGGIIDRIDQIDHAVRIIDYKTGADTTVFRDIPSIFDPTDNNRNKAAFQTLLYCLMFGYNHPEYPVLIPGIYSTKLLFGKDYNYKLKCNNSYISDFSAYREDFYQLLTELLSRLFSSDNSFTQTLNEKKCRTCPYSGICRK